MKKRMTFIAGLAALLMLSGCIPENKMSWSPDGQQAVVLADGGLYRCSPDGTLSEKLLDDAYGVAWRADSRGLVLGRIRKVTQWPEVESLLGREETALLSGLSDAVYAEWKQSGDPDAAMRSVVSKADLSDNQAKLLILFLRQTHSDMKIAEPSEDPVEVGTVQLARLDESGLALGEVLGGAADGIGDLRIAPGDDAVAFTAGDFIETKMALNIAPFSGEGVFQVALGVSLYPDWSTDGRYLLYAVAAGGGDEDDLQLGAIARRQVADENGLLKELPDPEELVGILMNPLVRVRCLPDNSIVFTSSEVRLPAVAGDMPEYMNFFRFDPARQSTVERMFPRNIEPYLGEWSMWFEPSPDGRKIAFLDADNRVAVVTVSSGELKHVPDSDSEDFLPIWRGNDEIYCVCSFEGQEDGEIRSYVARYRFDEEVPPVEASASWPEAVMAKLKD